MVMIRQNLQGMVNCVDHLTGVLQLVGQGQEWEVRPRQLEPYDGRETLSGNRRGPYGPGDAPAGGGVNPFWSPEVQRRAAQAQPVSAGRATTDDRGRQQGQEEDLEALRLRVMRDAEEIFEREVARLQAARTRRSRWRSWPSTAS